MSDEAPRPPVQRVTFGGIAATVTTVSTLLVALASMFTAVQAMNLSKGAAQQTLFQNQMNACLALNEVASEAHANNDEVFEQLEDLGPEYDTTEAAELRKTLVISEANLTALQREYLKLSMLLPSAEVYDTVFAAQEVHFDQHNLAWDMMVAGRLDPAGLKRFEGLIERQQVLLNEASTGCGRYVRGVVDGGRINN